MLAYRKHAERESFAEIFIRIAQGSDKSEMSNALEIMRSHANRREWPRLIDIGCFGQRADAMAAITVLGENKKTKEIGEIINSNIVQAAHGDLYFRAYRSTIIDHASAELLKCAIRKN